MPTATAGETNQLVSRDEEGGKEDAHFRTNHGSGPVLSCAFSFAISFAWQGLMMAGILEDDCCLWFLGGGGLPC